MILVVLTKGGTSGKHIQREDDAKSQGEDGHLPARERPETDPSFMASEGTNPANSLILKFQLLEP